jgi:hypothetical protein
MIVSNDVMLLTLLAAPPPLPVFRSL